MVRRWISALLACAVLTGLCGCSGESRVDREIAESVRAVESAILELIDTEGVLQAARLIDEEPQTIGASRLDPADFDPAELKNPTGAVRVFAASLDEIRDGSEERIYFYSRTQTGGGWFYNSQEVYLCASFLMSESASDPLISADADCPESFLPILDDARHATLDSLPSLGDDD